MGTSVPEGRGSERDGRGKEGEFVFVEAGKRYAYCDGDRKGDEPGDESMAPLSARELLGVYLIARKQEEKAETEVG